MTRHTRTIVAVTLLATALCADRAVVASSASEASRVEAGPVSRGFAERLTVSLRRVVAAVKLHPSRQDGVAACVPTVRVQRAQVTGGHAEQGTPFQFRLPPPL